MRLRDLPSKPEMIDREQRFLNDFVALLKAAHYRLLTQAEWDMAVAEEFQLTMPVSVNWKYKDDAMLARYWEAHRDERVGLAEMSDRVLVFHRGVGVAKMTGLFLSEKVDLIVEYGFTNPLARFWNWILRAQQIASNTETREYLDENEDWATHKNRKIVQRRTLDRVLPNLLSVLKNFHKSVEIQEPTFRDMIILYRKADHQPKDAKSSRQSAGLAMRNIFIKSFSDVPMADVELIFPEKTIFIKSVTKIQLTVMVFVAVFGAVASLIGTNLEYTVIGSALMLVLGRCAQVYSALQRQRAELTTQIAKMLYSKAKDSQEGALFSVLDEMASQYYKEVILAYSQLVTRHGLISPLGLDEECESFLEENFNLRIDFDIETALARLEQEGLVYFDDSNGLIIPRDLDAATEILKEKWHSYFTNLPDVDETESFLRNSKYHKASSFAAEAANFEAANFGASTLDAVKQGFRSGMRGVRKVFTSTSRPDTISPDTPKSGLFHRIKNTMTRDKETVF